jgi:hypothetical protein
LIALWTDAVKTIPKYTFDEAPANCANHKRKKLVLMLETVTIGFPGYLETKIKMCCWLT